MTPDQLIDRRARVAPLSAGLGKIPPQATDLEEDLLGSMMNHESTLMNVIDFVQPEYFYKDNHQKIYSAIKTLFEKHQPVDELTIVTQLRKQGELEEIGGMFYITDLSRHTRNNWDFNSKIIYEKYLARETIRISTEAINTAYDDTADVFEMLEKNQSETLSLTHNKTAKQSRKLIDLITDCRKEYSVPVINGITGVPTGLTDVDRLTHGWQNGDLIIIAARPAMGKTAFVLQCAKHPAINLDKPVVIFSLEMSDLQLTNRIISGETDTHLEKILTHNLSIDDERRIDLKLLAINEAPIIIDDTPALNIFDFRAKCRRLKAQQDIQLIIVDYLQLMEGKKDGRMGNREQEISSISRALKTVAKELNVPVIALSQLSRAVETRPGSKRPMLSDLRESGSIEQDADMVLFLYRDEYYGIHHDKNGVSTVGKCDVIIAKNRNGKCETAVTDFNGAKMRFKDWTWGNEPPLDYTQPMKEQPINHNLIIQQAQFGFEIQPISSEEDPPF
jgi:replicative DNA helicase